MTKKKAATERREVFYYGFIYVLFQNVCFPLCPPCKSTFSLSEQKVNVRETNLQQPEVSRQTHRALQTNQKCSKTCFMCRVACSAVVVPAPWSHSLQLNHITSSPSSLLPSLPQKQHSTLSLYIQNGTNSFTQQLKAASSSYSSPETAAEKLAPGRRTRWMKWHRDDPQTYRPEHRLTFRGSGSKKENWREK